MDKSANKWKKLNPDYEIKLFDDQLCRKFIIENYGKYYGLIFDFLKDGPIKADFWRACVLYKNGGVYSDIDNVPLVPLKDFIQKDINFVTCSAYMENMKFNPNFIISSKNHIILKKCIDWYVTKYERRDEYNYWKYSIMQAFTDVLELENYNNKFGIYSLKNDPNMKIQIIEERPGQNHYDAHNVYNNIRIFNNIQPGWNADTHSFN